MKWHQSSRESVSEWLMERVACWDARHPKNRNIESKPHYVQKISAKKDYTSEYSEYEFCFLQLYIEVFLCTYIVRTDTHTQTHNTHRLPTLVGRRRGPRCQAERRRCGWPAEGPAPRRGCPPCTRSRSVYMSEDNNRNLRNNICCDGPSNLH